MTTKLIRSSKLIASAIDDELVMMDMDQGNYFSLNAVGAHIWTLLETPHSLKEVLSSVIESFEAPEQGGLEKDVSNFLQIMIKNELIQNIDV